MRRRFPYRPVLLALSLAAASVHVQATPAASAAAPEPAASAGTQSTLLSVTADGESRQVPDVVRISAGVSNRAQDANTALAENSGKMNRVAAAIRAAGVAERDVQTARISIQPHYRYPRDGEPVFTGYQASNSVTVKLRDVARLGDLLDALVAGGANQIDGPYFEVDQPQAGYDRARLSALASARERAQQYAAALGLRVRRIVSVDEGGGFRQMQHNLRMAMAEPSPVILDAAPPVSPGETTLRARLSVVFELGD